MVCWGWNRFGQLGIGSTSNIGSAPGQMGSNLTAVDMGAGDIVSMRAEIGWLCDPISTTT